MNPKTIGIKDWRRVRQAFGNDGDPHRLLSRLAVELMYYGCLSATEVANIQVGHIVQTEHATVLNIPSRPHRLATIYLLPPVILTLQRLGINVTTDARTPANHANDVDDRSQHIFMSARAPGTLIKGVFRRAAQTAATRGDMETANRLMALTAHSLHHAFEFHARQFDDRNWVWSLIGAVRLLPAITRAYLPPRRVLTEPELKHALRALAPCWNDPADVKSE